MPVTDNMRGALFMCVSMFAFTFNDSLMKSLAQDLPLFQSIAMRGALVMVALVVIGILSGGMTLWPRDPRDRIRIMLRALADVAATILFLAALRQMPLANISAILQAVPLAVTLGAALVFREKVGWRRATAIALGFAGVLMIVRPGGEGFGIWSVMALGSVLCVVLRDLTTRGISREVGAVSVAIWTGGAVTTMGLAGTAIQGWVTPDGAALTKTLVAATALTFGYMFSVMTMRVGDVGFVAPFRYTALIWAILLGWVAFGTLPDGQTLLGALIVVGSGLYALWRERRLRLR